MVIKSVKDGAIWLDPAIAQMVMAKNPALLQGKPQSRATFQGRTCKFDRERI